MLNSILCGRYKKCRVRSRCHLILQALFFFAAIRASSAFAGGVENTQLFDIDDYFKLHRITEIALSSDGEMIAYTAEIQSLNENKTVRSIYISSATAGVEPILIDEIQDAKSFAWMPDTYDLAYLASDDGVTQLYSINSKTKRIRQHTRSDTSVTAFRFGPDGAAIAWLAQSGFVDKTLPLYNRLFSGDEGVIMNPEGTAIYAFVNNPNRGGAQARPAKANKLWLKRDGGESFAAAIPGQVKSFHWSSDGSKLSVMYAVDDPAKEAFSDKYTSLGAFDVVTKAFETVARGRGPSETEAAVYYAGGEWVPDTDRFYVRRITERDAWTRRSEWRVFDLSADELLETEKQDWREIEIYRRNAESAFIPADANTVFFNNTLRARQSLHTVRSSGFERADIARDLEGSVSLVQFSADFETAAFVNESLTQPPEIYIWRQGESVQRLTNLNSAISAKCLPKGREIAWKSKDGATAHGWLLEPVGEEKLWPLVTFVHGGPGLAFLDEFAFYFRFWPYPFEAYTSHGIAVFIPNYRGTRSFGVAFAHPEHLDGEPVDDIVSGIQQLIRERIADPGRLAISGHSHGAWLAPLVMTRSKLFQAGSFAEGLQNKILTYILMPGRLNRITHDVQYGVSLYDDPQRYLDLSPDLHMKELETAVLFEAGAKSLAVATIGSPKAAARAGLPAEFIVYPQTGHNIRKPRLQKESAIRNLDWFRFWLQGYEDPPPEKKKQYDRWRKMRDEQCERLEGDDTMPWYCRH